MTRNTFIYLFIYLFSTLGFTLAQGNNVSINTGFNFGDLQFKATDSDTSTKSKISNPSNPYVLGFSYARDLTPEIQIGATLNAVFNKKLELTYVSEYGEEYNITNKYDIGNNYDLSIFGNYTFYTMDKFSFFATAGVGYSMGRKIKFNYTEEVTVVGEPKAYSQLVNVPAADWNKFLNSYSSICKTLITTNEDVTITGIQNPKGSTAAGGTATCIGTSKATTTEDVKKVKEVNFNSVVYNVGLGAKYEVVSNIDLMLTVGYTGYTQASQTVDKTKFTLMGGFVATQISVGYRF